MNPGWLYYDEIVGADGEHVAALWAHVRPGHTFACKVLADDGVVNVQITRHNGHTFMTFWRE